MKARYALIASLAIGVAGAASAADLLGTLKSQAGNFSMPQMDSSTMGNAAGVLQYCVKNNYLAGGDANAVKDKLMGAVTGQQPQQEGYATGAKGLLQGTDGQSFDLKNVSGKLKTKACDYVLKNAKSLV
ncbi:MAG: DUF2501 domain-containing protein [Variovorax sp.]